MNLRGRQYLMASPVFTVSQAAEQLETSRSTVRRWASDYAAHLSPLANPERGKERRFTIRDIEILREVSQMRALGVDPEEVGERLKTMVPAIEVEQLPTTTAQASPGAAVVPAVVVDSLQRIEDRLQALEGDRRRMDVVYLVLIAFIAGLLLGLAVWWFR
jgi:DNA-binding transcriptional MerR regulator